MWHLLRKSHQDLAVRFVTDDFAPTDPNQGPAIRFVTADIRSERVTSERQYDLLRPTLAQSKPPTPGSTTSDGRHLLRKSHQDLAVRFVTAETAQKERPRPRSTFCYGRHLRRKSHQDPAVLFVTADTCAERATKIRQSDLLRRTFAQAESSMPGSTICYGRQLAVGHFRSLPKCTLVTVGREGAVCFRGLPKYVLQLGRSASCQNSPLHIATVSFALCAVATLRIVGGRMGVLCTYAVYSLYSGLAQTRPPSSPPLPAISGRLQCVGVVSFQGL